MTRSRQTSELDDVLPLTVQDAGRDLPVAWDGVPVVWGPWGDLPVVFICPPPRDRAACTTCGSTDPPTTARGRTQTDLGSRLLVAYRCPGCHLDTVWDAWENTHWTLDDSDYGPNGSTPP